jgi:hypothetical protein
VEWGRGSLAVLGQSSNNFEREMNEWTAGRKSQFEKGERKVHGKWRESLN